MTIEHILTSIVSPQWPTGYAAIHFSGTSDLDLLTSKLLCQLLLMCVSSPLILNNVWFSAFELMVGMGWINGRMGCTKHVMQHPPPR